jgi:hypothetical protein
VKRLAVSGGPLSRDSRPVLIPTALLYLSLEGSMSASSQTTRSAASVTLDYRVVGLRKVDLEELALVIQTELATRLQERGMVVREDDAQVRAVAARPATVPIDTAYGVAIVRDRALKTTFGVVASYGAQPSDLSHDRSLAAYRALAREHDIIVMIPELWFTAPQLTPEKGFVPGAVSARMTVSQGMDLQRARLTMIMPTGATGFVSLKDPVTGLSENVGAIVALAGDSTRFGTASADDRRAMTAAGLIGLRANPQGGNALSANSVELRVSRGAYSRAVLRGAASFFQAGVAVIVPQ